MSDPATLYAACAAAAGALVAIMGGFLISRVVGLLAQKEALRSRRRELDQRLHLAEAAFSSAHMERLGVSVGWFDDAHLDDIVEQRGQIDIEEMTQDSNYVGTTEEEMRQVVIERARQVRDAFARIEGDVPSGKLGDLTELGIDPPEGEAQVWEAVASAIRQRRNASPGISLVSPITPVVIPKSDIVYRRQDERIREERMLRSQVQALHAEVGLVDEELNRLGNGLPRIMISIAILAYFAFGSVAYPLALLASSRVTDSATARWSVWGLFLSGLLLLVGFLIWSAWPLRFKATIAGDVSDARGSCD